MSTTDTAKQGQLIAEDSTRFLVRQFTGHIVGQPGMGYAPLAASVVSATATTLTVDVTIDGFGTTATTKILPTFRCYYEPHPGATPSTPPSGSKCFVLFVGNDSSGLGVVVAFRGWPS